MAPSYAASSRQRRMPWGKCSSSGSGTAPMPHIPQGQGAGPSSITIRTASPGRSLITRTNFSIFNTSEILLRACPSTHRRLEGVKDEVSAKKTKIILKKGTAVPQYEILPSPLLINHVYQPKRQGLPMQNSFGQKGYGKKKQINSYTKCHRHNHFGSGQFCFVDRN